MIVFKGHRSEKAIILACARWGLLRSLRPDGVKVAAATLPRAGMETQGTRSMPGKIPGDKKEFFL